MIDLHTHTNESDGSYTPAELVSAALDAHLEALAITDHDTFAGYDAAVPLARDAAIDLICGLELSTKFNGHSVHLLGYFPDAPPAPQFREWLLAMQTSRRDRNRRMVDRLRSLGVDITIEEVIAKGRSLAGRPHFAKILVEKGYVRTTQEAFDEYLDESAKGYVQRMEPTFEEAVERIRDAGGVASLPHAVRVPKVMEAIPRMIGLGLAAIEVYHSDHTPQDSERFLEIARKYQLKITGGSDFHGEHKPKVRLGCPPVPKSILDSLRRTEVPLT